MTRITNLEDLIEFTGTYELKDRGTVYCGKLKFMASRQEIMDTNILLFEGSKSLKIIGVEAPCIPDPLRAGSNIGLLAYEFK